MKKTLQGRVLVVTGASAGIGRAAAFEAAARGARVLLSARREEKLREAVREIEAAGGEALAHKADVSSGEEVEGLVARALEAYGRVDAFLANAGYGFLWPAADLPEEDHRKVFEVNYWGTVRCVKAVVPVFRKQGRGHLLVTSSFVGKIGLPWYGPYSATKAAQDALATALRLELEPEGIQVSSIYPIGTATEFHQVSARITGRPGAFRNTPSLFVQSARHVGRRIARCLERPVPEVWPSGLSRWLAALGVLSPRLTRLLLRGHSRKCARIWRERNATLEEK